MNVYVVDASVAVKWLVEEPGSDAATRVLEGEHELHAPQLLLYELDSVLCKWIRSGIITKPEAAVGFSKLMRASNFVTFGHFPAGELTRSTLPPSGISVAIFGTSPGCDRSGEVRRLAVSVNFATPPAGDAVAS